MHRQVTSLTDFDVILIAAFVYLLVKLSRSWTRPQGNGSSPPGPPGNPIVGHTYLIPRDRQWLKFDEWVRQYGDIVLISVMGKPTVILGSIQAATDLLDNRGTIYSDRPTSIMAGELVGWDRGLGYSPGPQSPRFREFRRLFHQFMGPRPASDPTMQEAQEINAARLISRLLNEPEDFITHVRQSTGALILRLAFGYEVSNDQKEDPLVNIAEQAMQGFALASQPGAFLVDTIPILKYLPKWVPGARFQSDAAAMRGDLERLYDAPFDFVKAEMARGRATSSFVSRCLEDSVLNPTEHEELIKAAAASLYSGGADTTPSSLASFILAMTLYPAVQTRAQAELDAVIGNSFHRFPSFEDRSKLPYIQAMVLEILRWYPAVPLGLAHKLTQDDVYRGYHLKKGTVIWANIWTMLHDENVFHEPSQFCPERFLDRDGNLRPLARAEDPVLGFGFGRRICPGMHFANNSIFIAIAMMLYVFRISKALKSDGEEVTPKVEYDGFIAHPRPFKCVIVPRSPSAEVLIRNAVHGN